MANGKSGRITEQDVAQILEELATIEQTLKKRRIDPSKLRDIMTILALLKKGQTEITERSVIQMFADLATIKRALDKLGINPREIQNLPILATLKRGQ